MSQIQVDNIYNKDGDGSPGFPLGANVTGVITATTFKGGAEITSGTISATSVTATTGSFTSNVSIGGTLTYEDVTNIDSVGLITARQGVKVSAAGINVIAGGVNIAGVVTATNDIKANGNIVGDNSTNISGVSSVTATTYYGSGASLSGIEAAPTIQAVANGTIASEAGVIVESDGKVAPITAIADNTSGSFTAGTDLFVGASEPYIDGQTAYDTTTGRIVLFYRALSAAGKVVVGTRSGNSITWASSPVDISSNTLDAGCLDVACIGTDKFVFIYGGDGSSDGGYIRVITTASNNTFTAGTEVTLITNGLQAPRVEYDSVNNGILMIYSKANSYGIWHRWATVSGTTLTVSAETQFGSGAGVINMFTSYNPNDAKMCVIYSGNTTTMNGDPATGLVFKNPGSAASQSGSINSPYSATGKAQGMVYNHVSGKYYAFFTKNNGYLYYKVGSFNSSGNNVTWNTEYDYNDGQHQSGTTWTSVASDIASGKIFLQYQAGGKMSYSLNKTAADYSLDNLVIKSDWNNSVDKPNPAVSMGTLAFTFSYNKTSVSANAIVSQIKQFATTDVTTENFIGFSKAAYTNGQTATVKVVGNVSTKSSLTPGKKYYVTNNGSLSATAADPIVVAGRALTATSLLIQPN